MSLDHKIFVSVHARVVDHKVPLDAVAKVPFWFVWVVSSDRYERHKIVSTHVECSYYCPNTASQQFDDVCLSAIGSNTIWIGVGD